MQERTTALVVQAVRAGFRAIDTAAQRKHYRQDLVGEAIAKVLREDGIKREELFLQTKYTSLSGQDQQGFIPYDPKASIADQVTASFENSLRELQTPYIDSLLLHGPERTVAKNVEALKALKPYIDAAKLRHIGISNIYSLEALAQIEEALHEYDLHISFIQNRFYADTGYDVEIRRWCKENNVIYQSFWTLTANPDVLQSQILRQAAERLSATAEQVMYQFCIQEGIIPLNGTTKHEHMELGVQVLQDQLGQLTGEELHSIRDQLL